MLTPPPHCAEPDRLGVVQIADIVTMQDFLHRFAQQQPDGTYAFSKVREGLIVGMLSIGTLIGALCGAPLADRFGRRKAMQIDCFVFSFVAVLLLLARRVADLRGNRSVGVIIQVTSFTAWYQVMVCCLAYLVHVRVLTARRIRLAVLSPVSESALSAPPSPPTSPKPHQRRSAARSSRRTSGSSRRPRLLGPCVQSWWLMGMPFLQRGYPAFVLYLYRNSVHWRQGPSRLAPVGPMAAPHRSRHPCVAVQLSSCQVTDVDLLPAVLALILGVGISFMPESPVRPGPLCDGHDL